MKTDGAYEREPQNFRCAGKFGAALCGTAEACVLTRPRSRCGCASTCRSEAALALPRLARWVEVRKTPRLRTGGPNVDCYSAIQSW